MEKKKITESYVKKQIEDCKARIKQLEMEYNQNTGVIAHCEWLLKNIEMEEEIPVDKTEEKIEEVTK